MRIGKGCKLQGTGAWLCLQVVHDADTRCLYVRARVVAFKRELDCGTALLAAALNNTAVGASQHPIHLRVSSLFSRLSLSPRPVFTCNYRNSLESKARTLSLSCPFLCCGAIVQISDHLLRHHHLASISSLSTNHMYPDQCVQTKIQRQTHHRFFFCSFLNGGTKYPPKAPGSVSFASMYDRLAHAPTD